MCPESSAVFRLGRIFSGPNLLPPTPPSKSRPNSYWLDLLIVSITNSCVSSDTFISQHASKSLTITESIKNANNRLEKNKTATRGKVLSCDMATILNVKSACICYI